MRTVRSNLANFQIAHTCRSMWHEAAARLSYRLQPPADKTVLFFCTTTTAWGTSSRLRAVNMAESLSHIGWRAVAVSHACSLKARHRLIRDMRPGIIVLQKSGHPLNRPELYGDIPIVFDIDDADFRYENYLQGVIECCRGARAVSAGSRYVAQWCKQYNPHVKVIWTGAPIPDQPPPPKNDMGVRIIAWAHSRPMQAPEEARLMVQVMRALAAMDEPFEFWLYGFDGSPAYTQYLTELRELGIHVKAFPLMRYPNYLESLRKVDIGLQPLCADSSFTQGKSFGKILGYLAAGAVVVASNAADHPLFFRSGENGLLVDAPEQWVEAIRRLLKDSSLRQRMADQAWTDFQNHLSIEASARKFSALLDDILLNRTGDNAQSARHGQLQ